MSVNFAQHVAPTKVMGVTITQPTEKIAGRESQMVINSAGGAVFEVDCFTHLLRFLILGTEGGTYYADEKQHTYQAFQGLKDCIAKDASRTVNLIVEVSDSGRAASNDPALFALAAVMAFAKTDSEKFYARQALPIVARIGTHLFHFAEFIDSLKGWGSGTRKTFQDWYLSKSADELAFQYVKYTQRDGWSHRDLLRKSHPLAASRNLNAVFSCITHPEKMEELRIANAEGFLPQILLGSRLIKSTGLSAKDAALIIKQYKLPREAVPTELLNSREVWEVLLPNMKPTALIRNLGKLTSIGMLAPMGDNAKYVASVLTNKELLKRARIHPLNVLKALTTYSQGHGDKGSLRWTPTVGIVNALQEAFEYSFDFVEPSGKNLMLALDVSGSMIEKKVAGNPGLNCAMAAACMALITAKVEPNYTVMGFSDKFTNLNILKTDNIDSVMQKMFGLPFARTDCSLPMQYAAKENIPVDMFQIYTDNETYMGHMHPSQALKLYRAKMGLPKTKLAVVTFEATRFSIADPNDPFMTDFVGFDSNGPQAMAEMAKM